MDGFIQRLGWQLTCENIMPVPVHLRVRLSEIRDVLEPLLGLVELAKFILEESIDDSCRTD